MKKVLISLLTCSILILSAAFSFTSLHAEDVLLPRYACSLDCSEEDILVSSETTSAGTRIDHYQSGVLVERLSESEWIIHDYPNRFGVESGSGQSRSWVAIGLAILKHANYALAACQAVQYVTGHDICRTVLNYLSTPHGNGTYTYELTGNYIPGYIPGCEPAHSLPCNSGYWQYRVVLR